MTLSLTAQSTVQNYERLKQEHDKKVGLLTKQEVRGVDYLKMEKNGMEMESLESKMLVATQSIDTTTSEIIRLRESELFLNYLSWLLGQYHTTITPHSFIYRMHPVLVPHMSHYFLYLSFLHSTTCICMVKK